MSRLLESASGIEREPDRATVAARLAADGFVWLDVEAPGDADLDLVREALGVPAPVLDGASLPGRRPSFDEFDDHVLVTAYGAGAHAGADEGDSLVAVQCVVCRHALVTLHEDPCPALAALAGHCVVRAGAPLGPAGSLHRVIDHLVESLLPLITRLDARGDELADMVLEDRAGEVQRQILDTRRSLISLRRVVIPQRDMLARLADADEDDLPGMTPEIARRLRGAYERMVRVGDSLDGAREAAQAATDVYLGTVNNRLNQIMKQLTVIAGIFLPLTFLTGFFGQNFGWMVGEIGGLGWFLALGIGLQAATVAALMLLFRRRGWF